MKRKFGQILLALIHCLLLVLLAGEAEGGRAAVPPSGLRGRLLITGSSTMHPLIEEIGRRFQSLHPGLRVEVQSGGSRRGVDDARTGRADIGMVSRAITESEKGLSGFPIARDGVSIIVHRDNPVKSLSSALIADIFTGRITNWKRAGGPDAAISVLLRGKERGSTELIREYVRLTDKEMKGRLISGDVHLTIRGVAADPHAIGYVSSGVAERMARSGVAIRLVAVDNVKPTGRNVITGNYPITRPLNLVTRGLPAGAAKEFIDFCLSAKVVDIVERYGFVPYED